MLGPETCPGAQAASLRRLLGDDEKNFVVSGPLDIIPAASLRRLLGEFRGDDPVYFVVSGPLDIIPAMFYISYRLFLGAFLDPLSRTSLPFLDL